VFYEKGNTPKALLEYREAETFAENIDNDNLKGLIQGNLGILFHGQHIYDKSISRGKKAIEMYRKAQNYKNEISAICLIGDCFLLEKEIDSAFLYYNKSVKLADDHKIPELQVGARQNISVAFRKTEKYAIAKKYLTEALTFEIDSMEKARIFMNFSKIYTLENNIDSAKFYINKSLELKIKERTLLRSIYFSLSKIAEQEGNYAEALKHFNKYNEYVAQVVAENMSSALLECNEKYDFVKLKTKAYELAITRRGVINSVLLFVIVIIVIAFVFYRKLEKIQKKILEKEQKFETLQMMYDNLQRGEETVKNIIFKQYNMLIEIALLEKNLNPNKANDKEYMLKKLNLIIYKDEKVDFEPLYELMNQIQNDFYEKVRAKYGKLLTKQEFRVCCFTCEKFADSEISIFLNMTVYMVRKRRHDIKKKLNIPDGVDIYSFLIEDMKT
jgi:tetratricopeptide (TPR) repeat protein